MAKKLEGNVEDLKYCDYSCEFIKFQKNSPLCHTFDIIHCKKYNIERDKSSLCLDYDKGFQKIWRKYGRKTKKI